MTRRRSTTGLLAHVGLGARVGLVALAPLAPLAACRFGGPSGDPSAYVAFPEEASDTEASSGGGAADDSSVPPTSDATTSGDDGDNGNDANGAGSDDGNASAGDDSATGCTRTVAVCDPVHDTGCNPFQQCDVDTTQMTTPTGICVFNSASEASAACMATVFTESCPAKSTCVGSACRDLCVCDSDCPAGQCCSDTSGPPGFTLCQACP